MSFQSPELSTMFPAKSQKTHENVWFSPHFEESEEKRAKACMKNTRTTARQKRCKTLGFEHVFEERASNNDEKRGMEPRPRGLKNA